jgi:hypothetical protein
MAERYHERREEIALIRVAKSAASLDAVASKRRDEGSGAAGSAARVNICHATSRLRNHSGVQP